MNGNLAAIKPSSVCIIILAYGPRTEHLKNVLEAVLDEEPGHVIVVANAVNSNTDNLLKELEKRYKSLLEIIHSDENIGSSGGYALGLQTALNSHFDFFWLLDDDNLPNYRSLIPLLNSFVFYNKTIEKRNLMLQSLRVSLPSMKNIVQNGMKPHLPKNGSFIGFHILNLKDDLNKYLNKYLRKKTPKMFINYKKPIKLHWSTYGGLFMHRNVVDKIGLPNPDFFIDMDDLAYTLKFSLNGGNIFLVPESRLTDLDPLSNVTDINKPNIYRQLNLLSDKRCYYRTRNRIYLGKLFFPGNPITYFINKWLYLFLLFSFTVTLFTYKRFNLIIKAIRDGEQARLGKNNLYE